MLQLHGPPYLHHEARAWVNHSGVHVHTASPQGTRSKREPIDGLMEIYQACRQLQVCEG